nr:unnamed protein product [Callosobruchus analis]
MRGRGGRSYYRGSSRGSSWGGSRGSYMGQDGGGGRGGRYMSGSDRSFDSRSKYGGSERFSSSRPSHSDEYKSYRSESSYMGRESGRRSPERKRIRMEGSSSRHENSYTSSSSYRHDGPPSSYHERSSRGYSDERHGPSPSSAPYPRRDDFRSPRGSYRGRLSSSRGGRGTRDRPRRRLMEASYSIRRRLPPRMSEFGRRAKISRLRSMVAERRAPKRRLSERMDSDEEKKEDGKEGESGEEKSQKKDGSEKDAKSDSGEDKPKKGGFIKLHCVHCGFKSLTFRRYEIHLRQKPHIMAMRRLSYKQKSILSQMRQAQRSTQNEIEKDDDDLTDVTHYCLLCKLNYKQKKSVHQLSESHKNMKKFLMPTCKVCSINFKSPMSYEAHLCSIDHMKTKQRSATAGSDSGSDADEAAKEEKEKKEKKQSVCVGIEQIRTIQAHYCDLCKMYLPRGDDDELSKIISRHCKMRIHMQRYVRHKERQALEKKAEKLQRKELAEKQGKSGEDGDSKMKEEKKDDGNGEDDKLWADVDKDLGDILAEAETGNKSSDEDEEDSHINGERYDRFKLSEKLDDDKIMKEDEESILDNKPELKEKLTQ